ncbi:hypothetical protein EVAR_14717_1 [Eumeta japonica]|uniref:Uncharacterized protein n=1 Tax=Eumeta variegata TaxID=151549 RepID=A0A4C1TW89_EUMVA|nr:hypothetical protein EVAR_14717_1 [Eumeta japonica]
MKNRFRIFSHESLGSAFDLGPRTAPDSSPGHALCSYPDAILNFGASTDPNLNTGPSSRFDFPPRFQFKNHYEPRIRYEGNQGKF